MHLRLLSRVSARSFPVALSGELTYTVPTSRLLGKACTHLKN